MRKVRSLTLRTVTPGTSASSATIVSACSASDALQVMSTTRRSAWDSTTSSAVRTPLAVLTAATRPLVAPEEEGVSTRTVIA